MKRNGVICYFHTYFALADDDADGVRIQRDSSLFIKCSLIDQP
jgi:hypothetical protein